MNESKKGAGTPKKLNEPSILLRPEVLKSFGGQTTASPLPEFFEEAKFIPNNFAVWLTEKSGQRFLTIADTETIYRYVDGIYVPDAKTYIKGMVEQFTGGRRVSTRSVSEAVGHVERKRYVDRSIFDNNEHEIALQNGVLNTTTFEFTEHSPDRYFLQKIPVAYDPSAECPMFTGFLENVLPDKNERDSIIELFGYCLVKNYSIQRWFMFYGSGGNGKGTLLSVLSAFLGHDNVSTVELQNFDRNFTLAELYGKLANIAGDLSHRDLEYSGKLKGLTGGDRLLAERKFQNPFNFVNHAKLIFSANELPRTHDETIAFWRRVMLFNFKKTFIGNDDTKNYHKFLTTESELSGILNLAIEGLQRLNDNMDFSKKTSIDEVKEFYVKHSDSVTSFIMDCVEITYDPDNTMSFESLHKAYLMYCQEHGFTAKTKKKLNRSLRNDHEFVDDKGYDGATGEYSRRWSGVILSLSE